ncbi:unnamed protein product, partial [Mesorhabditis belari]|uniref:Small ribosomal subunit protein uS2m n=1 Tax=Mesorhabditis belari TaxID=2138241 RepID=A0AAF3FPZ7_9BILA
MRRVFTSPAFPSHRSLFLSRQKATTSASNTLQQHQQSTSSIPAPSIHRDIKVPSISALEKASTQSTSLKPYVSEELQADDYFNLESLVNVKEMFDARLHLGHKIGTLNDNMKWALYGERLGICIFDLDVTKKFIVRALNFVAHVAARGGIILFVTTNRESMLNVEKTAKELGEYSHCRRWQEGTLTNSAQLVGATIRLPDTIIFLSTLTSLNEPHPAIIEAAKLTIPTVGVVDSNTDPAYLTYLIPANDDTPQSAEYLLRLFKEAITRGKAYRKKQQQLEF